MLSIHNNLSAGAYVIIMLVYRRLLQHAYMTKQLCDSSVIANNARKTQKLFIQGYNLEVQNIVPLY